MKNIANFTSVMSNIPADKVSSLKQKKFTKKSRISEYSVIKINLMLIPDMSERFSLVAGASNL